jgi:hypothetical protein
MTSAIVRAGIYPAPGSIDALTPGAFTWLTQSRQGELVIVTRFLYFDDVPVGVVSVDRLERANRRGGDRTQRRPL